jgi:uncharacterized repeat protein (TIGR01451 family)
MFKSFISKRLLFVGAILALALLTSVGALGHSGDVFSAYATVTPTIDGVEAAGEWSDADCQTNAVNKSTGGTSDLTICVKNDDVHLFILIVITNQAYDDGVPGWDFLSLTFDNDHDGTPELGDERLSLRFDNLIFDGFNHIGGCICAQHDTVAGGTNDLVAMLTHTNPVPSGVGTYTAEYQHPLDSADDAHDFSLASGDEVGFNFRMSASGGFFWPGADPRYPPGFADLVVATPSVQISKDGPATALAGDLITYTLEILNSTSITLTNVVITDVIPTGAHYISGGTLIGDVVSWNVPSLESGAIIDRQFSVTANGTITNDDYRVSSDEGYSAIGQDAVVTHIENRVYMPIVIKACAPLFADNFEDPASGWFVDDDGNIRWEHIGGEYRILLRNADWWGAARTPGFTASNYVASVDVRNGSGSFGSYGLLFGLSSDWRQMYIFEVYADGFFEVWKGNDGGWSLLASGSSAHIKTGTATNRLRILREGSLIRAYANGHQLAAVSDNSLAGSRYLGLIVTSYDEPNVDVFFDNFVVYSTSCHPYETNLDTAETTSPRTLGGQALSAREQDAGRRRMEMMAPAP